MADEDLRALERSWAEGAGDLASGDAFFRALERAGADTGRLLEVRLQVLRAHVSAAGLDARSVSPLPEVDPLAVSLVVPGERAVGSWHALRRRLGDAGVFPVLVGEQGELERALEFLNEVGAALSPGDVIDQASRYQPSRPAPGVVEAREHLWPTYPVTAAELPVNAERVVVALLPTRVPWHAAAYLRLGADDGGGPDPLEHVARHRSWFETHGAEPARISPTDRRVDLWVVRPPRTRAEALVLAAEQVVYCDGLLREAAGMLEYVAARLLNANVWSFEW